MNRFFSHKVQDMKVYLEDQEALHCAKVLRHKINDKIEIIDGSGQLYIASIEQINKSNIQCNILESTPLDLPTKYPDIGFCLLKNPSRMEWVVEKIVEIGVRNIHPLVSQNCERVKWNAERFNKICISAMKQSQKVHLPTLHIPMPFSQFIDSSLSQTQSQVVAHFADENAHLLDIPLSEHPLVLIGPEGDFTKKEIELAQQNGFRQVNLGNSRLRAETAVIVATAYCVR